MRLLVSLRGVRKNFIMDLNIAIVLILTFPCRANAKPKGEDWEIDDFKCGTKGSMKTRCTFICEADGLCEVQAKAVRCSCEGVKIYVQDTGIYNTTQKKKISKSGLGLVEKNCKETCEDFCQKWESNGKSDEKKTKKTEWEKTETKCDGESSDQSSNGSKQKTAVDPIPKKETIEKDRDTNGNSENNSDSSEKSSKNDSKKVATKEKIEDEESTTSSSSSKGEDNSDKPEPKGKLDNKSTEDSTKPKKESRDNGKVGSDYSDKEKSNEDEGADGDKKEEIIERKGSDKGEDYNYNDSKNEPDNETERKKRSIQSSKSSYTKKGKASKSKSTLNGPYKRIRRTVKNGPDSEMVRRENKKKPASSPDSVKDIPESDEVQEKNRKKHVGRTNEVEDKLESERVQDGKRKKSGSSDKKNKGQSQRSDKRSRVKEKSPKKDIPETKKDEVRDPEKKKEDAKEQDKESKSHDEKPVATDDQEETRDAAFRSSLKKSKKKSKKKSEKPVGTKVDGLKKQDFESDYSMKETQSDPYSKANGGSKEISDYNINKKVQKVEETKSNSYSESDSEIGVSKRKIEETKIQSYSESGSGNDKPEKPRWTTKPTTTSTSKWTETTKKIKPTTSNWKSSERKDSYEQSAKPKSSERTETNSYRSSERRRSSSKWKPADKSSEKTYSSKLKSSEKDDYVKKESSERAKPQRWTTTDKQRSAERISSPKWTTTEKPSWSSSGEKKTDLSNKRKQTQQGWNDPVLGSESAFRPPEANEKSSCKSKGNETRECVEICAKDGATCKSVIKLQRCTCSGKTLNVVEVQKFDMQLGKSIYLASPHGDKYGVGYVRECGTCVSFCQQWPGETHSYIVSTKVLSCKK